MIRLKKQAIIILLYALFQSIQLNAQNDSNGVTLSKCLKLALENNHQIKKAKYDQLISEAKTKEVSADLFPQINASAGIKKSFSIPVVILPGELLGKPNSTIPVEFGSTYDVGGVIELNQIIFSPSLFVGIKTAKSAEELIALKTNLTKEELIYNVSVAFYDILHNEQQLISIKSNLNMQDSLYKNTAHKVEQDIIREIDLNRIGVNIANLEGQIKQLDAVIEEQIKYFNILLGIPWNTHLVLDKSCLCNINTPSEIDSIFNSFSERSELLFLQRKRELGYLNVKSINSQYLPNILFIASAGYQFQDEKFELSKTNLWFDHSFIGLRVSIPIFDGLRKQKQKKQARFEINKLDEEIKYARQLMNTQLANAQKSISVGYESIKVQKNNLLLAEKIYEQSRLLYKEELYNVTDLLYTEMILHDAQVGYWSEVIKYKKAELELLKAKGTLNTLLK